MFNLKYLEMLSKNLTQVRTTKKMGKYHAFDLFHQTKTSKVFNIYDSLGKLCNKCIV